ncbi:MAG TPA: PAS domain-containing protein [Rhizomicrobium sp.]
MSSASDDIRTLIDRSESTIELVIPETLESAPVRGALRYWKEQRGARLLPERAEISPRAMAPFLRNIVLIGVINGGADYEYRIAEDAYVQAFGLNFKGMRLSQIAVRDPLYGAATRATYEHVRVNAEPFAVRGWVAAMTQSAFSYHETVFMPLGAEDRVDHILVASTFMPRGNIHAFTSDDRPPGGELPHDGRKTFLR